MELEAELTKDILERVKNNDNGFNNIITRGGRLSREKERQFLKLAYHYDVLIGHAGLIDGEVRARKRPRSKSIHIEIHYKRLTPEGYEFLGKMKGKPSLWPSIKAETGFGLLAAAIRYLPWLS